MEAIGAVLNRVLANCRVRMDKRKRKAGGAVEAPPVVTRGKGGVVDGLAGKERATLRGAPSSQDISSRAERRPTAATDCGRLEAAE